MEYTHQVTSCNSKQQYSLATSMFFVGLFLGPFVGGISADKIGRRPVCLAFGFMLMILNFFISVTKTPFQYAIGMFGIGMGTNGLTNAQWARIGYFDHNL
jgi:MFS family permease